MNDLSINSWDFPVDTYDLKATPRMLDHKEIEVPQSMARAVVRTDTNQVLGVHGSKYKVIRHDDVVNSIFDAVSKASLGTNYEEKIEVFDQGRKLRGTINFPDLTIEPSVGDYINFQIVFFNSYDGSWAFGQQAQGLRLWCLNGCTSPDTVARTLARHTTNVSVKGSAAKIQSGLNVFANSKELYQRWMRMRITTDNAEHFFKSSICKLPTKTSENKYNNTQLENLMGEWHSNADHLGSNKWALYNSMTSWATHTDHLRNPPAARRLRENQVAKAVKWIELA